MGNCVSCFKDTNDDYQQRLIRDILCDQCHTTFLSNYEYNKHIPTCGYTAICD